jgi:hypothetical protein
MNLVGPSYPREALAQVGEDGGVYRDRERRNGGMDLETLGFEPGRVECIVCMERVQC